MAKVFSKVFKAVGLAPKTEKPKTVDVEAITPEEAEEDARKKALAAAKKAKAQSTLLTDSSVQENIGGKTLLG